MKELDLDALGCVAGGVSTRTLGLTMAPAGSAVGGYDPHSGSTVMPGGVAGAPGGSLLGSLGGTGTMINELLHSPAANNVLHGIEQLGPIGNLVSGAVHMLESGNLGNLGQLVGQIGNLAGGLGGGQNGGLNLGNLGGLINGLTQGNGNLGNLGNLNLGNIGSLIGNLAGGNKF